MYKIYGYPKARPSRCIWVLEEIGKPYEIDPIKPRSGDYPDEFVKHNPTARVPLFRDGDFFLSETGAICKYLALTNPEAKLMPSDPQKIADIDRWILFSCAELEQAHWIMAKHKFAIPEQYRMDQSQIRKWCEFEFSRNLEALEWAFKDGRPYICGKLTVADFLISMTLMWAKAVDLNIGSMAAYVDRMKQLPSYEKLKAVQAKY